MSERIVKCRGEDRLYQFDPAKTALIVIDMQRHFLPSDEDIAAFIAAMEASAAAAAASGSDGAAEADGSGGEVAAEAADLSGGHPDAAGGGEVAAAPAEGDNESEEEACEEVDMREIIPHVARLLDCARQLGCHVFHTREGYSNDFSDVSEFRRALDYVGHETPIGRTLIRGEAGHDFVEELRPLPGEMVIDKASFGAFCTTDLDDQLRAAGVTHLVLCGVTTQCCVHSTLREAVDLGYWCLTIADCCAASEPALHEAALTLIAGEGHLFGWVAEVADFEASSELAIA